MFSDNLNNSSENFPSNEGEVYLSGCMINHLEEQQKMIDIRDIHILSCIKQICPTASVSSSGVNVSVEWEISEVNLDEIPNQFKWAFMRGIFDRYGHIIISKDGDHKCSMRYLNEEIKGYILSNCDVSNSIKNDTIVFTSVNVVDFLSKIYDNSKRGLRSETKYEQYVDILNWTSLSSKKVPLCKFVRTKPEAVIPTKNRATDEGYDLTIIEVSKRLGENTLLYDTCIKLLPEFGYYFDIVPRSSLSKSGYCISNSIGIIDRSYRGTVKIALTKIDNSFPDIELPYRCAQMILRKSNHYCLEEGVEDDDNDTNRGDGGFGSTNK